MIVGNEECVRLGFEVEEEGRADGGGAGGGGGGRRVAGGGWPRTGELWVFCLFIFKIKKRRLILKKLKNK